MVSILGWPKKVVFGLNGWHIWIRWIKRVKMDYSLGYFEWGNTDFKFGFKMPLNRMKQKKEKALVKKKIGIGRVSPIVDGPKPWAGRLASGAGHDTGPVPLRPLSRKKKEAEEGDGEWRPATKFHRFRPRRVAARAGEGRRWSS